MQGSTICHDCCIITFHMCIYNVYTELASEIKECHLMEEEDIQSKIHNGWCVGLLYSHKYFISYIMNVFTDAYKAYLKAEGDKKRQSFVTAKISEFLEKMNAAESQYLDHSRYYICMFIYYVQCQ